MPTVQVPAQLSVEHLLAAIKQLSPAELEEFTRQFRKLQEQNGQPAEAKQVAEQTRDEAASIQIAQSRLPARDERRLKRLIAKSERGTLTPKELDEYRALVQQAEQQSVARVEALAELARRRGKPARVVMQEIGWSSPNDDL